jgi:hypothetical protein
MPAGQSLISESLSRILGMQPGGGGAPTAGTAEEAIALGKGPLSYISGAADPLGLGVGNTSMFGRQQVPSTGQTVSNPAAAAPLANPLIAAPTAVAAPAAPLAPLAPPAPAAPVAPKLMTLSDYDTWMKELYNQKVYQDYGGNVKFRDLSQGGSWTDWLKAHGDRPREAKPVFGVGGRDWGEAGRTTMVDPTTGQVPGQSIRYLGYGAAYRPQTGDYAKDWAITNMVRGGGPAPSLTPK